MLSYSVVEQAKAALVWLYKKKNLTISKACLEAFAAFSKGYKKRFARARKEGTMKSNWVLMSRSFTVTSLMYDHISWRGDSLVVEVKWFSLTVKAITITIYCRYPSIKAIRTVIKQRILSMSSLIQMIPKCALF